MDTTRPYTVSEARVLIEEEPGPDSDKVYMRALECAVSELEAALEQARAVNAKLAEFAELAKDCPKEALNVLPFAADAILRETSGHTP